MFSEGAIHRWVRSREQPAGAGGVRRAVGYGWAPPGRAASPCTAACSCPQWWKCSGSSPSGLRCDPETAPWLAGWQLSVSLFLFPLMYEKYIGGVCVLLLLRVPSRRLLFPF